MELERIKRKLESWEMKREEYLVGKRYYANETEIKEKGVMIKNLQDDPFRNADNRINHNFHEILVDEKAAYMFTYPVQFEVKKNEKLTKIIQHYLGNEFERKAKNLCVEASNCGRAWLHYWITTSSNQPFRYAVVPTEEVLPIYENGLERELKAIIRTYICMEEVIGELEEEPFTYIEYWTNQEMIRYKFRGSSYQGSPILTEPTILHKLGKVPFIEFANNGKKHSDLSKYKGLIDLYNRVMSGFANDLEDIQQLIYIIENYGGTDLQEFLQDLKRYKAIKVDSDDDYAGRVQTMQIDIPVEAKRTILEIIKKQIYESGQGLQQDVENVGNASGVALKFFYRKLELKAGLLETEFRTGFSRLVNAILDYLGMEEEYSIMQTFTRNMISNDLENAQIAQMSVGIISNRTLVKNHPWGEDLEAELEQMAKERKEAEEEMDTYSNIFETTLETGDEKETSQGGDFGEKKEP